MVTYLRGRAARGELREPILLARAPEDIAALEATFTQEQRLLTDVVGRIESRSSRSPIWSRRCTVMPFAGDFCRGSQPTQSG